MGHYLKDELNQLLKQDESIFDFIQADSFDGLSYWDLEQPENKWLNSRFWQVLGYDPTKMEKKSNSWNDIINADDLENLLELINGKRAEIHDSFNQVVRYTHKNGSIVRIKCRGIVIRNNSRKATRFLATHKVITDFEQTEDKLLTADKLVEIGERQLKDLFKYAPVGFGIWDSEFRYLYLNEVLQKMNGPSLEDHLGRTVREVLPKGAHLIEPLFKQILEEGISFNNIAVSGEVPASPGKISHFIVSYFPLNNEKDELKKIGGLVVDITEQKEAEKKLKESEVMFRLLAENSVDFIWKMDLRLNFTYVSPSIFSLTGYTQDEWIGTNIAKHCTRKELFNMARQAFKTIRNYKETQSARFESKILKKNGEEIPVEIAGKLILDEKGLPESFQGSTRDITERKLNEEAIITSQKRYESLFNNSPIPLWEEDFSEVKKYIDNLKEKKIVDYREYFMQNPNKVQDCAQLIKITDLNNAVLKLHEAKSKTELFDGLANIFTKESYEAFTEELIAIAEGRTKCKFEGKVKTLSGKEKDVYLKWMVVPGYEETLEKVYISTNDITVRKRSELNALRQREEYEALNEELRQTNKELFAAVKRERESNDRLDKAMDATDDGIWDWDLINNSVVYSKGWFKMLGIEEEDHSFNNWKKRIHENDRETVLNSLNEHLEGKNYQWHMEHRLLCDNGKYKWVNGRGKIVEKDENNKPMRMVGTMVDIEERKETEYKIRESEEKLRLTIDNSPLGVATVKLDGRFVTANKAFQKITGYNIEELRGLTLYDITHPDDRASNRRVFKDFIDKKSENFILEKRYIRKNGRIVDVRIHAGIVHDVGKRPMFALAFIEDISQHKQAEKELITAKENAEESNRLKSEFLHNMSHEIRTPMNGIMGFADLLGESGTSDEQLSYYTNIIKNSSKQLMRIIDDILEISILETKQQKLINTTFRLNDFIMELFAIFDLKAKDRMLPLYVHKGLSDVESTIVTDKNKLGKILNNLLENAFKFTSDGSIELGYYTEKNKIVLYVKDTGIGISPENVERIFKRFSQENKGIAQSHGGLGLGLSIARENAQLLGGDISVESEKGEGSTFRVSLPFKTDNVAKDSGDRINGTHPKPTCNILVAEDEEVNYLYLETILTAMDEMKCKVIHAKNGKEAVDFCNNNTDLVLMDIKMPIMNGYQATEEIRKNCTKLPIIALTAYSTEADRELALKHGCNDFISKPVSKEYLFELILKYLT